MNKRVVTRRLLAAAAVVGTLLLMPGAQADTGAVRRGEGDFHVGLDPQRVPPHTSVPDATSVGPSELLRGDSGTTPSSLVTGKGAPPQHDQAATPVPVTAAPASPVPGSNRNMGWPLAAAGGTLALGGAMAWLVSRRRDSALAPRDAAAAAGPDTEPAPIEPRLPPNQQIALAKTVAIAVPAAGAPARGRGEDEIAPLDHIHWDAAPETGDAGSRVATEFPEIGSQIPGSTGGPAAQIHLSISAPPPQGSTSLGSATNEALPETSTTSQTVSASTPTPPDLSGTPGSAQIPAVSSAQTTDSPGADEPATATQAGETVATTLPTPPPANDPPANDPPVSDPPAASDQQPTQAANSSLPYLQELQRRLTGKSGGEQLAPIGASPVPHLATQDANGQPVVNVYVHGLTGDKSTFAQAAQQICDTNCNLDADGGVMVVRVDPAVGVTKALVDDMQARLRQAGGKVTDLRIEFTSGTYDMNQDAKALEQILLAFAQRRGYVAGSSSDTTYNLIGHSAGGLIALKALQDMGRDGSSPSVHVQSLVTVGSPFEGSQAPNIPGLSTRFGMGDMWPQLRQDSAFTQGLIDNLRYLPQNLVKYSIASRDDEVVDVRSATALPGAFVKIIENQSHSDSFSKIGRYHGETVNPDTVRLLNAILKGQADPRLFDGVSHNDGGYAQEHLGPLDFALFGATDIVSGTVQPFVTGGKTIATLYHDVRNGAGAQQLLDDLKAGGKEMLAREAGAVLNLVNDTAAVVRTATEEVESATMAGINGAGQGLESTWNGIKQVGSTLESAGEQAIQAIEQVGQEAWDGIKQVGSTLESAGEQAVQAVEQVGQEAWDGIKDLGSTLESAGEQAVQAVEQVGQEAWDGIKDLGNSIESAGQQAVQAVEQVGQEAWDGVKQVGSTLESAGEQAVQAVEQVGQEAWNGVKQVGSTLESAGEQAVQAVEQVGQEAWNGVKQVGSTLESAGEQAVQAVEQVGQEAWDGVKQVGSTLESAGEQAVQAVEQVGQEAWDGIKDLGNTLESAGQEAWDGAKDAGSRVASAGASLWRGITGLLSSASDQQTTPGSTVATSPSSPAEAAVAYENSAVDPTPNPPALDLSLGDPPAPPDPAPSDPPERPDPAPADLPAPPDAAPADPPAWPDPAPAWDYSGDSSDDGSN